MMAVRKLLTAGLLATILAACSDDSPSYEFRQCVQDKVGDGIDEVAASEICEGL